MKNKPRWHNTVIRAIDIGISLTALILEIPVFLVMSMFIKSASAGPVFTTRKGIGRLGQEIKVLKFRTTAAGRPKKIGLFLHRTGLDSLPVLLNVLRGDTSLFGHNSISFLKSSTEAADTVDDSRRRIIHPPGANLRAAVEFFYSSKTVARVFDPILADLQYEWMEAVVQKQPWKARWVRIRGYWTFWQSVGLQTVVGFIRKMLLIWRVGL